MLVYFDSAILLLEKRSPAKFMHACEQSGQRKDSEVFIKALLFIRQKLKIN